MLIITNRHTKEDLKIWESYEEADLIYYQTHDMSVKENFAIKIIKEFNPNYISISWGKDSTVLAHLAFKCNPDFKFAHFTHKADAIYFNIVRDTFLKQYNLNYYEFNKEINEIINEFYDFHKHKIKKQAEKKLGGKYVTGIRIQESGIRKITVKQNGLYSNNSCRPLAYWTSNEIFAYLAYYQLPVHPNYAMLGGGRFDRNTIRVGPMWMASQMGNELWEKEYYNDILKKLNNKDNYEL